MKRNLYKLQRVGMPEEEGAPSTPLEPPPTDGVKKLKKETYLTSNNLGVDYNVASEAKPSTIIAAPVVPVPLPANPALTSSTTIVTPAPVVSDPPPLPPTTPSRPSTPPAVYVHPEFSDPLGPEAQSVPITLGPPVPSTPVHTPVTHTQVHTPAPHTPPPSAPTPVRISTPPLPAPSTPTPAVSTLPTTTNNTNELKPENPHDEETDDDPDDLYQQAEKVVTDPNVKKLFDKQKMVYESKLTNLEKEKQQMEHKNRELLKALEAQKRSRVCILM